MKQTVNSSDFHDAFERMGRGDQFSYEALDALFDYLEQYEEETGEEMELDVIALCCDFTEYENLEEFNTEYGKECETLEDIEEFTQVIPIEGTDKFIIQNF
jgi:hypothetical protein